jgi:hypothetical protein
MLFDVTPPDLTLIDAVPELAMRLAGTDAVNWVALTRVVVSAVVFHRTVAPEPNPVPFTVNVNPALPAVMVDGVRNVMAGPATTVKFTEFDVTPPEVTVTRAVPGVVTSLARTVAVNCVELTNTVPRGLPFQFTTAPEAKPLPVTVIVNAGLPAVIVFGLRDAMVGPATTVKDRLFEVTPLDVTLT